MLIEVEVIPHINSYINCRLYIKCLWSYYDRTVQFDNLAILNMKMALHNPLSEPSRKQTI